MWGTDLANEIIGKVVELVGLRNSSDVPRTVRFNLGRIAVTCLEQFEEMKESQKAALTDGALRRYPRDENKQGRSKRKVQMFRWKKT
jgi:hypothetical protein